jgi:hypothetical protein
MGALNKVFKKYSKRFENKFFNNKQETKWRNSLH